MSEHPRRPRARSALQSFPGVNPSRLRVPEYQISSGIDIGSPVDRRVHRECHGYLGGRLTLVLQMWPVGYFMGCAIDLEREPR